MGIVKIENGVVVQVDRTTNVAPEGWVECGPDVACGMLWDGEEFSLPPLPAPAAPRWSFLEFMERFTQAEQEAIAGAAMVNVQVKLWYDKAVGAKEIIADEPRTVAGMDALVAAGLLTQARRDEILGA